MPHNDNGTIAGTDLIGIEATVSNSSINGNLLDPQKFKLHFSNVTYITKQRKKLTTILNDVCGEFKPGRLTAILGPSGAGKTSILNVLSGFKANGVSGKFTFNDQDRDLLAFRKTSCYIPQEFALIDLLTVQETIADSVDLKLPAKTMAAEKEKIIDNVLQILNMDKCRHRLVRNLSGGERKRLSIAIELVTNPPVMFFDEPTSGLDSVASLQVISYLKRLALDGRIIACVVHQPSSRLIQLFDDVVVMSRGHVLYAGPEREMISAFEAAGFTFPEYYNPADFALEVSSEEHNEKILSLIERNKERHCGLSKHQNEDTENLLRETTEMLNCSQPYTSIEMRSSNDSRNIKTYHEPCHFTRAQVSSSRQLFILTRRSLRSMSRNLIAVQLRIAMHIIVATLVGAVFWDIGNDGARTLSNISCIFFIIMFIFFGNAMPAILLCPQDTAVFIREYLNGWYSLSSYYASKLTSDLPILFICPTLFTTIIYFMTSQPNDIARFAMCWGISLILAIIGHFMGLTFGSTFDMQMAILLVPGIAIPFMIFSGFFIRIHELSSVFQPLCDISFFRYTMEALMQAIYSYDRPDLECHREFCYLKSPTKLLKELDMFGDLYGHDLFVLLLWILFFKVLFFLSLLLRIKRAQ